MTECVQLNLKDILAEYVLSVAIVAEKSNISRYKIEKYKKDGSIKKDDYEKLSTSFPLIFNGEF